MIRSNNRAHAVSLFMVRNGIHRATGNRVALQTSRLLPTRYVVADRAITTDAQSPSAEIAAAFDSLQHSLRAYLRRQVKDLSIAEDLLQDIFVKALAASDADRAPKNLQGWLYAVARTTVIDFYRSTRPAAGEVDKLASDSQDIDDELLHRELATCLRPLVGQLPAIYRDTLLATDFDGETMQAVANAQGLSVSAIKSRASRARVMLRQKLLDCCHVEISSGTVTDYHLRSSPICGECGSDII